MYSNNTLLVEGKNVVRGHYRLTVSNLSRILHIYLHIILLYFCSSQRTTESVDILVGCLYGLWKH